MEVTWLGHSTVLLELDSTRIITDPILRDRVAHLQRVGGPSPVVPERLDAILISHKHLDHLDKPSLRLLPRDATVVVPRGVGRTISRLGFGQVTEVVEGDVVELGGLRIRATHADHSGSRVRPLGYLIDGPPKTYFAGDTDVFPAMAELAPRLELAFLPVSGWGPRVPKGHLDPERAAQALELLRPRVCVPIHWGTLRPLYRRRPYDFDTDAGARLAALAPTVDVRVLAPGDRFTIEAE